MSQDKLMRLKGLAGELASFVEESMATQDPPPVITPHRRFNCGDYTCHGTFTCSSFGCGSAFRLAG